MAKYQVNETSVELLSPSEIKKEARELRYQLICVDADIATNRSWGMADGKTDTRDNLQWKARAQDFLKKLRKRYALIRPLEKELNRVEYTSRRTKPQG